MTFFFIIKVFLTLVLIVSISELSKSSNTFAALLASLPLVSILSIIWIYSNSKDISKIINISYSIFWLVIPSLLFFISLPTLLKYEISFYISICISIIITLIGYYFLIIILNTFGIKL